MNIHASIIDQRLDSLVDNIRQQAAEDFKITDDTRLKSLAFVFLCVKTILDLEDEEAFDCLTEGSGDFGVDAIHISEEYDGEFTVSLFQAKYEHKKLEASSHFPETGISALINAIKHLFDPSAELQYINPRLRAKVEEVRSLIRDGYIPQVRALACNNGLIWNAATDEAIERAGFGNQVTWEHLNHERLVTIIQASKPVSDALQLSGKALVEDMDFSRVLLGRVEVNEIATLIERHGERLLERNIRRYLGLQGNRINEAISNTLHTDKRNFYFYNNGITLTCDKFSYNALQNGDYQVRIENLQIINGGQTCMTIFKTLHDPQAYLFEDNSQAFVLLRLYQLPNNNEDLVRQITYATNSQNPVDLRDLRANDDRQQRLEMDIQQLGFSYHRKRTDRRTKSTDVTSGTAAEAILAVWRNKPHQAKFFIREHFGKLYNTIFTEQLNGAQVIIAVYLYRIAENRRKRPESGDPEFVRYASCFIAMQMGRHLLHDLQLSVEQLSHKHFKAAKQYIEQRGETYFTAAVNDVQQALNKLYGTQDISLQQLSATFRRGDLIERL
ncbi:AIPR family protein [Candidatus Venteria ishoeyi]|uniref:AIPR protein n=1 Tax=Candidatus Venteria ishoeyi TaxID=1899563 RepID=A0A1H6FFJ1_9GAMM|nr:AIPR family protein [Candidatus Venteria ishoeyi]SEH08119.1 AIPR protein [Candidatus Venteria ishoeyi]